MVSPNHFFTFSHLSKREATGEGGLITGTNPAAFTTSDPLRLWIIQIGIIVITAQLLSLSLRRLRQPKVISEILGGVLLGPTALGRIPGFTENIFPAVSLPYLSLTADIGLCLYLFIVGLEIDTNILKQNARMSIIVSFAGIALPFGFGSVLSVPLYHHFIDPSVRFTYFMLFTGVAYSITALPILCRILTELNMLDSSIGVIVLSAGIGNDIVGYTLLALSVAFVNAISALSALWILLVCIAFAIFLLIPVRLAMHWLARKTGSIENGPTVFYMTVVIILVWASAFFTDSIGVNAIFGAFLSGLVVPREGGLAIALTEKLEDVVSIIFLPLFFALSGLNTNLGLLDNGITWAFTIAIIALSFSGKFCGCMIASRLTGYGWRESSLIGALMSCKGLIELIVLNVGLQAGILSQRVFSMFVLEALTLTCTTMPLAILLHPPERRIRVDGTAPPLEFVEKGHCQCDDEKASVLSEEGPWRHRFTVVLDKLDHIPGAMVVTQLLLPPQISSSDGVATTVTMDTAANIGTPHVSVQALQLIKRSDRTAMMTPSAAEAHTDPTLGIFRTFAELNELEVKTSLSVVQYDDFARSVAEHAQKHGSHLVLLPWQPCTSLVDVAVDTTGVAVEHTTEKITKSARNPFIVSLGGKEHSQDHSQFVRDVFSQSKIDVALFVDTGDRSRPGVRTGGPLHIFFPFFGGPDDRLALEFVVQLCLNPRVTATVVRMVKRDAVVDRTALGKELSRPQMAHLDNGDRSLPQLIEGRPAMSVAELPRTVYGQQTARTCLQSESADQIAWSKYFSPSSDTITNVGISGLHSALTRIQFSEARNSAPLHATIQHARTLKEASRLLIVAGRSCHVTTHNAEMKRLLETTTCRPGLGPVELDGMRKTMGDVGVAMMMGMGGSMSAILVLQAAGTILD